MIVTLCGSARFEDRYHAMNQRLTLAGHVVFSLAVYPSYHEGEKNWYSDSQKRKLDEAHIKKIDASDCIVVVGDGYIGESTTREIAHAIVTGKARYYQVLPPVMDPEGIKMCPYAGCFDPLSQQPPCALCYE